MINISCSEHRFNGLLDYKQAGKWVFKLSHRVRFIGRSVIWRWWENLLINFELHWGFHWVSLCHEVELNGEKGKKERAEWYIEPIQSSPSPFEAFWKDRKMMAISPQTKTQQGALKVPSVHCRLEQVFRGSLGVLWELSWTLADEKWLTEHRQNIHSHRKRIHRCPSCLLRPSEWI